MSKRKDPMEDAIGLVMTMDVTRAAVFLRTLSLVLKARAAKEEKQQPAAARKASTAPAVPAEATTRAPRTRAAAATDKPGPRAVSPGELSVIHEGSTSSGEAAAQPDKSQETLLPA